MELSKADWLTQATRNIAKDRELARELYQFYFLTLLEKPDEQIEKIYRDGYIQWVDAVADVEWQEGVKAEVHLCHTIGWIVDETDDALCIASTVSMDSSNARMHIPKQWITSRKYSHCLAR